MDTLLLIGAFAAISNLILTVVGTYLAYKRTKWQGDMYKWKKERITKEKP